MAHPIHLHPPPATEADLRLHLVAMRMLAHMAAGRDGLTPIDRPSNRVVAGVSVGSEWPLAGTGCQNDGPSPGWITGVTADGIGLAHDRRLLGGLLCPSRSDKTHRAEFERDLIGRRGAPMIWCYCRSAEERSTRSSTGCTIPRIVTNAVGPAGSIWSLAATK